MPRPVVVSIGGSVLAGEEMEASAIRGLADALDARCEMPLGLVVGGGVTARRYIGLARELGLDEAGLDHLGINITRANAWLLIAAYASRVYPKPAESFEEAALGLKSYDRVCMGGTHPGHSTDAVAAMLAERTGATQVVIVTNVKGVYTADPRKDPEAEFLEELSATRLVEIAGAARRAGSSGVVDPLAAQIMMRSNLPARVVSGGDPKNVAAAVNGESFTGTRVLPE